MENYCINCGKEISHKNNQKFCAFCKGQFKKIDGTYYHIKKYRKQRKKDLVNYKGGKCIICGYDKCDRALDFHHIDESTKSFSISQNLCRKMKVLKEEVDKCILVCSNCHMEIHEDVILLEDHLNK